MDRQETVRTDLGLDTSRAFDRSPFDPLGELLAAVSMVGTLDVGTGDRDPFVRWIPIEVSLESPLRDERPTTGEAAERFVLPVSEAEGIHGGCVVS